LETTIFDVDSLSTSQAVSVSNWLYSMPGVNDVAIDVTGSKITVVYDPATTDRGSLKSSITSAGVLLQ